MEGSTRFRICASLAFLVFVLPSVSSAQFHEEILLDADKASGIWTFTPLTDPSADLDCLDPIDHEMTMLSPGPIAVPSFWSDHNPDWDDDWPDLDPRNKVIQSGMYSRTFTVPTSWSGKRVKLHFAAANYTCEAFIKNPNQMGGAPQSVGPKHFQSFVPFEYDVTDLISADGATVHTLEITVADQEEPGQLIFDDDDMCWENDYPLGHPIGPVFERKGLCDSVRLYAVPSLYVKDVFVQTSVANKEITFEITIANEDTVSHSAVDIRNEVFRITSHNPEVVDSTPVLTVLGTSSTIPSQSEVTVTLTASWPHRILWSPDQPQLYRLHTELIDTGTQMAIEENTDVRFGFREFKVDGNHYSLNGIPFHGWGETVNLMNLNAWTDRDVMEYLVDTYKAMGCRLIRHGAGLAPSSLFYDVCDEKGILCYAELNYYAQGPQQSPSRRFRHNYKDGGGSFETNADAMIEALVKRDRNHPSIVIWSLSNEVFYASGIDPEAIPYNVYKDDHALRATNLKIHDSTRPVGCDSDGSLGDGSNPGGTHRLEIKNKHYPNDVATINKNGPEHGITDDHNNADPYWMTGIAEPDIPLGVGEFMSIGSQVSSDESMAKHPANWGSLRALTLRGYRLAGFSDIRPFTLRHDNLTTNWFGYSSRRSHMIMRHSMSPVAVFDYDYDRLGVLEIGNNSPPSFTENTMVSRNYIVFNDDVVLRDKNLQSPLNESITINWEVILYGTISDSGSETVTVPLGRVLGDPHVPPMDPLEDPIQITWTVPEVDADDTPFVVALEARKAGERVFRTHYVFLADDTDSSTTFGLDPVTKKGTFADDFESTVDSGWREHDTFWQRTGGLLRQPESRGLIPNNSYYYFDDPIDDRLLPTTKFGFNAKIAGIDPYTYQDFRMSCDVRILATDVQGAGMGIRLPHLSSSPWWENDVTRQKGYFVKFQRNSGADKLQIGIADPFWVKKADSVNLPASGSDMVRLEVEIRGDVITASANSVSWQNPVSVNWTDSASTYPDEGFVSLIMEDKVAAEYDNVQVGTAPFAPFITSIQTTGPTDHVVDLTWTAEEDWGMSSSNVSYRVDYSSHDDSQSGSSTWLSAVTSHSYSSLPGGLLTFHVHSRDADGQVSVQSLDRSVWVDMDGDEDGDGVTNITEYNQGSDMYDADTDGDGLDDGEEASYMTDVLDPDTDDDFLTDGEEVDTWMSDPKLRDTDSDHYWDVVETNSGTDATLATSVPTDLDWLTSSGLDLNGNANYGSNGIVDGDEWALICEAINDTSHSINAGVIAAWEQNFDRLYTDSAASSITVDGFVTSAAHLTLGDYDASADPHEGAVAATITFLENEDVWINPGDYDLTQATTLAYQGDADGDGVSNVDEYGLVDEDRMNYLDRALDPLLPAQDVLYFATTTASASWSTVEFGGDVWFTAPVVVCTVNYGSNAGANNTIPMVARVKDRKGASFDLKLDNPAGNSLPETQTVHYVVCEEGDWELVDGRKLEAHSYSSTVTDYEGSWVGESRSYGNTYTDPVVLGQVMTATDDDWSVFWSCGPSGIWSGPPWKQKPKRYFPADDATLWTGKHVADDSDTSRDTETVGYIVIEEGTGTVDGLDYEAFSGDFDLSHAEYVVRGIDNGPPFTYSIPSTASVGVGCLGTMRGKEGAWFYLYGTAPLDAGVIDMSGDESQIIDAERSHPAETGSVFVVESSGYFFLSDAR